MSTCSLYTVYDNRTDEPVIVSETAKECAKRLNIKECSFYSILSRFNSGKSTRWAIVQSGKNTGVPRDTTKLLRKTFGQKVKYHRCRKGMTIVDLAEKIGVSPSTISLMERDRSEPTLLVATCLADVFGVSLDYLAGRKASDKVEV